jgi:hypothetical protein
MIMKVYLEFSVDGRIATLVHPNGLILAEFIVHGPFCRNAKSVANGSGDRFSGVIRGIGDKQYIDRTNGTVVTIS